MTEDEYIEKRLNEQLAYYSGRSKQLKSRYHFLRMTEIVAAALIPMISGIGKDWPCGPYVTGLLGMSIAVIAGAMALFKYHEQWIQYRTTVEQLKHEKVLFATRTGDYSDDDRFPKFVSRVEQILMKEHASWAQTVATKPEGGKAAGNGEPSPAPSAPPA